MQVGSRHDEPASAASSKVAPVSNLLERSRSREWPESAHPRHCCALQLGALHTSIADLRPRADANSSLRPGKPPLSAEPDPPPELGINQRDFPADEIVRGLGAEIDNRDCRMLDGR